MKTLMDSTILTDFLRGVPQADAELARHPDAVIGLTSWIEVMVSVRSPQHSAPTRDFLARFTVIEPNLQIAALAAQLQQSWRPLSLGAALVLASARTHGLTLHTRDPGIYPPDQPDIRTPYFLDRFHEPTETYTP